MNPVKISGRQEINPTKDIYTPSNSVRTRQAPCFADLITYWQFYRAYSFMYSRTFSSKSFLFISYCWAASRLSGSSGFIRSVNREFSPQITSVSSGKQQTG